MSYKKHIAVVVAVVTVAGVVYGQRRGGYYGVRRPGPDSFKGSFTFCRLAVRSAGWAVDYPRADENLMIRLSELTKTPVNFDETGTPHYVVITATDAALFQCPFVMLTDPAQAFLSDAEAAALRAYLQKGGFLWSDDFWGSDEWDHWIRELRKILPGEAYSLVDLPISHPIFHTLFDGQRIPQIPNIGFYMGTHRTSERGADSVEPHVGAILDSQGRIMVLITHNTDFGDAYQREGDDPDYFYKFSVEGYAIGIDIVLYAMTH